MWLRPTRTTLLVNYTKLYLVISGQKLTKARKMRMILLVSELPVWIFNRQMRAARTDGCEVVRWSSLAVATYSSSSTVVLISDCRHDAARSVSCWVSHRRSSSSVNVNAERWMESIHYSLNQFIWEITRCGITINQLPVVSQPRHYNTPCH